MASAFALLRNRLDRGGLQAGPLSVARTDDGYRLSVAGDTHHGLAEEDLRALLVTDYPAHLREWAFWHERAPQKEARWAFLRWIETADETSPPERRAALTDGVGRTWGQLRVAVRLRDGRRVYQVRHVEDAGRDADALAVHTNPLDARRLAKYDDDGRYRPLSTAPTLQTGWVFRGLDAAAAVQTVDTFYPATIANWYREQTGTLDVTHWTEATDRQTGIYGVTAELRGEAVDWVAEACCADSQCLKRRRWDERPDRPLPVPRGEGTFPCREPCSLVIAAARTWALREREDEQTYTIRLTPSEKEQLDALLNAAADGTTGEVREADVRNGANRLRARFLRAKRADDQGHLPFREADED